MNGTKLALLIAGGAIVTGVAISVARAASTPAAEPFPEDIVAGPDGLSYGIKIRAPLNLMKWAKRELARMKFPDSGNAATAAQMLVATLPKQPIEGVFFPFISDTADEEWSDIIKHLQPLTVAEAMAKISKSLRDRGYPA